jgi:hypothetical protein
LYPYGDRLYLMISPMGSKVWLMQPSPEAAVDMITFGEWPFTTLDDARRLQHQRLECSHAANGTGEAVFPDNDMISGD